jgi:hypothetical protein
MTSAAYGDFFSRFVGASEDGLALGPGQNQVVIFLIIVFAINFTIIYRGIARGIEMFCRYRHAGPDRARHRHPRPRHDPWAHPIPPIQSRTC